MTVVRTGWGISGGTPQKDFRHLLMKQPFKLPPGWTSPSCLPVTSGIEMRGRRRLVLFFTRGVSLATWDRLGTLSREAALYQRLQKLGFDVSFLTYGDSSELAYQDRLPGITILCNRFGLPQRLYEILLPFLHFRALKRAHLFKTNQTNGGLAALRAARLLGKPLVARCGYMWSLNESRENGRESEGAIRALKAERKIFACAAAIVVTTGALRRFVLDKVVPNAASRVFVVPNYVETDLFFPHHGVRAQNKLIFVGRISPEKNVDSLLKAIEPLDVSLVVIGDGRSCQELQACFGSMNGRVTWINRVPHPELPGYLNEATVLVLPSLYEGHPKVIIEAMACGTPVLGADSPGINELIAHGETGYLCGANPDDIRRAILDLLARPDLRQKLGRNARRYALENFSLDLTAQVEKTILNKVVNDSHGQKATVRPKHP